MDALLWSRGATVARFFMGEVPAVNGDSRLLDANLCCGSPGSQICMVLAASSLLVHPIAIGAERLAIRTVNMYISSLFVMMHLNMRC